MTGKFVCWRCGAALKDLAKPLPRLAKCRSCEADLHVCRFCRYYNARVSGNCDHELAEPAREVDIANFCQHFRPRPNAFVRKQARQASAARDQLDALFGTSTAAKEKPTDDEQLHKLKALFKD